SFARRQVAGVLEELETFSANDRLEHHPQLLWSAVRLARDLTAHLKPETCLTFHRSRSIEFP
ncbi:MAG: hypothetical protein EAZ61_00510, partial [Oscillatoriales cyanobacterium]